MPSRKTTKKKTKTSSSRRAVRPILWIGGSGLPGGATGKKLVSLGHPLHWEPATEKATRTATTLAPVLVVVAAENADGELRRIVKGLEELKSSTDFVVFQLRGRELTKSAEPFDGVLVRGPSLVRQIRAVLGAMEGSKAFKAAGVRAQKRLGKAQAELERLRNLAVRDDLTCLYNLRFFNRSLDTEHQRATRFGRSYTLVFLDLDGLREVNARRGHLAGGAVLKQVGELIAHRTRRIDMPARIGGDEFVVICPETTKRDARLVAERLRHSVQRLTDAHGKSLGITVSIGIASFPDDGDLPEEVLQRADRALYEAKALGKNRVCCWGEFPPGKDEEGFLASVHGLFPLRSGSRKKAKEAEEEDALEGRAVN
jgi:diguanylate cyclase (GGDEF)-like protein